MKKRFMGLALALVMCTAAIPAIAHAEAPAEVPSSAQTFCADSEDGVCPICGHEHNSNCLCPCCQTAVVTYRVVNGSWKDGSRANFHILVPMVRSHGTLLERAVPTDMIPDEGYGNGAWDVIPDTSWHGITKNVTYTYIFSPLPTDPVETEPVETEPVETEPVETEPVETEPVETEPVETEPVETEPVETEPVETEPVETEPVETEPVETEPVETEPVETEPVETEPAETEPVETNKPAETEPVETNKPAETEPVETNKPAETQKPTEKPVAPETDIPDSGDSSNALMYTAAMLLSGAAAVAVISKKRKAI